MSSEADGKRHKNNAAARKISARFDGFHRQTLIMNAKAVAGTSKAADISKLYLTLTGMPYR